MTRVIIKDGLKMSMGYRVSTEECLRLFSSFWRWRSYAPLPKFGLETRPAFESLDIACWLCHLPAGQTKYLGLPSDNWSDHESLSMVSLQLSFLLSVPKARFGQGYFKEGNPVTTFPTWLITEFTWKGFFLKKKKCTFPIQFFIQIQHTEDGVMESIFGKFPRWSCCQI